MRKAKKKKLHKLEVETTELGFTVWIEERNTTNGAKVRHWIIDGSMMNESGIIHLSTHPAYKTGAITEGDKIKIVEL